MFTEKELQVARMKLQGLKNKKIAEERGVSEADISQTLSRVAEKVKSVQDSIKLLTEMELIQEGPRYVMTEKGRKLARLEEKKTPTILSRHTCDCFAVISDMGAKLIIQGVTTTTGALVLAGGKIAEPSGVFGSMAYSSFIAGEEKSIASVPGTSEAVTAILNKKEFRASSTSELVQCMEIPSKRGNYQ